MAAYAALASLSQTTHLTINKHKSHFSIVAEEKIRSIHEYVIFLLSFLQDFPQKSKRWEVKMRDVAHEAEDIIEQYISQLSYNRWIRPSNVKFEDQLSNVSQKLCLMAGDLIDDGPAHSRLAVSSSSRVASTGNSAVVGLDEDLMAIKDRLCGYPSKLQVIPIVGMGGIGKTTLARNVYDDLLTVEHFHIRVWLTVSQDYNAPKVLLDVLHSINLMEQRMCLGVEDSMVLREEQMHREETDYSTIAETVYKKLKGRRYLIVMDDVWSTKVWDDVRNIFPNDGNGSRIMLTTRLGDIATYPYSNSPPHEMRFMDDSQSWDLLKGKVFANNNCPPELEHVGKEIAGSCAGLPLAVVLVAGFLSAVNKTHSSWEEISKNVNPSVGEELERILSLSYTHLPHHLRPCFLFIGVFPEDEIIRASRLIKLWVAEGFLKHQNGCSKSLEEEAEEYLEDLVKRNLVTVTSRKSDGKIKCCSLHDMVRDLCIRKALDERFLRVVVDSHLVRQGMINERRISFKLSDIGNIWCPTIHTMLCFRLRSFPSSPEFVRRFRLLRILDAMGGNSKQFPSQVFELFHLRYLALKCSSSIPSVISNLMNLQTLIILPAFPMLQTSYKWKGHWRIGEDVSYLSLPLEIWRMPQLRHIVLYDLYMLPHPPDGSNLPLVNLQSLSYIIDLVWTEQILEMIPNVKKLGLVYRSNKGYHFHLLKHLNQLEKLELFGRVEHNLITFPRTLKKLTLVGGEFPWEDMSIIGSLPNLQVLKLLDYTCYGDTWETTDGEFPQLRFLLIEGSALQHWITESSHFPRLQCLVLRWCRNLREIPVSIGEIPTLELIEVEYCKEVSQADK
ncbi:putative late blight resistance protein homolog R1B-16 [Salvia miltiorrhiza]|uniref:putative late blight resistance protein homolog R1B-16 n=1 Tax=Salvia miltiorrhiza TaxID=226208 RepID=UPI0025AD588C|nr:putative late blight resistance protein homolog R1B-16 [Salvia miltiorrhiza]XP_057799003.1 putative late blight resistance protein homolog R1B-16 [Salvia miltiorrhiza]XP_057799004.1 putative late blight resistance protein homolog R1B-16 [Salvia miltiorrhiza]XP_057799005.1 putative late blight resistance protein homolog R1B-16 [Salvia miltiorrhiza]XP_057799006.1 putative late blight resistance protein homolog R1B-16 [Salvia miltiorrhiza]